MKCKTCRDKMVKSWRHWPLIWAAATYLLAALTAPVTPVSGFVGRIHRTLRTTTQPLRKIPGSLTIGKKVRELRSSWVCGAPYHRSSPPVGVVSERIAQSGGSDVSNAPNGSSWGSSTSSKNKKKKREEINASKLRQLKDRIWVRKTIEDITNAEFAARLGCHSEVDRQNAVPAASRGEGIMGEVVENVAASVVSVGSGKGLFANKKKRAVDFENLLQELDQCVLQMCVKSKDFDNAECYPLESDYSKPDYCFSLVEGQGMGSVVYSQEQRRSLLLKVLETRQNLVEAMKKSSDSPVVSLNGEGIGKIEEIPTKESAAAAVDADLEGIKAQLAVSNVDESARAAKEKTEAKSVAQALPQLYVREDGTVDWEGALQDREALRLFGTEVWARINGMDPANFEEEEDDEEEDESDQDGAKEAKEAKEVKAKIAETEATRLEKKILGRLKEELDEMNAKHVALLESGISQGAAVANVNLAALDPYLRSEIRESAEALERKQEEVAFQTLVYELERIFVYLDGEMGNTRAGSVPLQDRLNVAEFGLLESQIDTLSRQLLAEEGIDADVLAVIVEQLNDFKRRLGIDYALTGFAFDIDSVKSWLKEVWEKTKKGAAFYGKGCQLFWNDIVFSFSLLGRAIFGYTLKPREVRTLRRTFKDILTFIPFVIILIIPLSPVGHVFVFGAIQRFFPDFFPSCFTERRQNLLQLYESTEYTQVVLNENLKDKMMRLAAAFVYAVANASKKFYARLAGLERQSDSKDGAGDDGGN